jgi:sporulation protein YlmC with PRC-barrel domain
MLTEVTSLYNLEVYTPKGIYLGRIYEVLVDTNKYNIYEVILEETNPTIVDESRAIGVPFRWIDSVSEIVVLKYFPGKIHLKARAARSYRKRRKLRVIKQSRGEHGITRLPWSSGGRSDQNL